MHLIILRQLPLSPTSWVECAELHSAIVRPKWLQHAWALLFSLYACLLSPKKRVFPLPSSSPLPPMRVSLTIPQPSLRLIHLSAPSPLWPHYSTRRSRPEYWFTWGKVHVFLSAFVCLLCHPHPSPASLPLSLSGFCLWPRYLKEILPHAVTHVSPTQPRRVRINSGFSEVKTRLFYIQKTTSWWVQSLLLQIYFHLSTSLYKRLFKRASFTLRGPIHSHYRNCWHMSMSFITPLNSQCRVHCLCFPKVCTFNM